VILGRQPRCLGFRLACIQPGQINLVPGQHGVSGNERHRVTGVQLGETSAQVRVTIHQDLDRRPQSLPIQRSVEVENVLDRIHVGAGVVIQGVKQQSFLHRRQRPHIHHIRVGGFQTLDVVLAQGHQGEIGRSVAPGPGLAGVLDQCLERLEPLLGDLTHISFSPQLGGETPGGLQPRSLVVVTHQRVNRQALRQRHGGITAATQRSRLWSQHPLRAVRYSRGGGGGKATQVVEPDLRTGHGG
jgi:hypothetical protein